MTSCATSAKPILILNCAEDPMQVVLGAEQTLLMSEEIHCPGQSIRHLSMAMERVLTVHNLMCADLGGVACVRGPGSFTGLRIAHAAMHGLARAHLTPMAGLDYLDLLARQARFLGSPETWVLTYARKGHVYVQGFSPEVPLGPARAMTVSAARSLLHDRPQHSVILGSALRKNPELCLPSLHNLPALFDTPVPTTLVEAATQATYSAIPPAPLYIRKSDAEDNLDAIARARGIAPEDARKHIFDFS